MDFLMVNHLDFLMVNRSDYLKGNPTVNLTDLHLDCYLD
jgi:hypothetical protein